MIILTTDSVVPLGQGIWKHVSSLVKTTKSLGRLGGSFPALPV